MSVTAPLRICTVNLHAFESDVSARRAENDRSDIFSCWLTVRIAGGIQMKRASLSLVDKSAFPVNGVAKKKKKKMK